jgi:Holliday junction resolvase RusA-like endonuclease
MSYTNFGPLETFQISKKKSVSFRKKNNFFLKKFCWVIRRHEFNLQLEIHMGMQFEVLSKIIKEKKVDIDNKIGDQEPNLRREKSFKT